ncbi:hypothetical protein C483_02655 [Natrialba hulunbeirensis JCM 10989]|uniref:Small CPxCG-related zinc finger protein n=1 Tax=Natrialba hulunbeirensis JCM 10989 TaxID=1227493 RepID=M0A8A3_9EURY|nr:hypothetical protein [Natrialba hulunbeirensis]ELY94596.1 hypothetical protein C483_02655 [Natrialba hulunbeirensis JCM 10989]
MSDDDQAAKAETDGDQDTDTAPSAETDTSNQRNTTRDLRATLGLDPDYTPDPDTTSLPNCPRCDHPVTRTSMTSPTEAIAGPCGCRVSPGFARRSRTQRRNTREGSQSDSGSGADHSST